MYIYFVQKISLSKMGVKWLLSYVYYLGVMFLKDIDVNHFQIPLVILHHDCIRHVLSCIRHWSFPHFRSAVLLVDFAVQWCFSLFVACQYPAISQRILLIYNYLRYEIADSGILQRRFLKCHVWGWVIVSVQLLSVGVPSKYLWAIIPLVGS